MTDVLGMLAVVGQGEPAGEGLGNIFPMIAMLLVAMWFIVLRPEQKQRKEREKRVKDMKKGDRIVSSGGIHGKVVEVDKAHKTVRVEVASKMVLKFNMGSISTVDHKDSGKAEDADAEDKKDS